MPCQVPRAILVTRNLRLTSDIRAAAGLLRARGIDLHVSGQKRLRYLWSRGGGIFPAMVRP